MHAKLKSELTKYIGILGIICLFGYSIPLGILYILYLLCSEMISDHKRLKADILVFIIVGVFGIIKFNSHEILVYINILLDNYNNNLFSHIDKVLDFEIAEASFRIAWLISLA